MFGELLIELNNENKPYFTSIYNYFDDITAACDLKSIPMLLETYMKAMRYHSENDGVFHSNQI